MTELINGFVLPAAGGLGIGFCVERNFNPSINSNVMPTGVYPRPKKHRTCLGCAIESMYFNDKDSILWYPNRDLITRVEINALCKSCYQKYIRYPTIQKESKEYNKKRITFKGERIRLEDIPRVGVCNICRGVAYIDFKLTYMHHDQYDLNDPLHYTMELCNKCHRHIHREIENEWINKYRFCLACGIKLPLGSRVVKNLGTRLTLCRTCARQILEVEAPPVKLFRRKDRNGITCYGCGTINIKRLTINRGTKLCLCRRCSVEILDKKELECYCCGDMGLKRVFMNKPTDFVVCRICARQVLGLNT